MNKGEAYVYVIDIGTNSCRLMLAKREDTGYTKEYKINHVVRTGEGVDKTKRLSKAAIERTANTLQMYRNRAKEEHPEAPIFCFATSAVRDAENKQEFLAFVQEQTGIQVDVLSGEMEAQCGASGAVPGENGGILDVGGGSTEIVLKKEGKLVYFHSFDVGAVRMFERFSALGDEQGTKQTYDYCCELFLPIKTVFKEENFIALGGSATTAAAASMKLERYDSKKVQNYRLTKQELSHVQELLLAVPREKRSEINGVQKERSDIIVYGLAIILAFLDVAGLSFITISEADNMEGYLNLISPLDKHTSSRI